MSVTQIEILNGDDVIKVRHAGRDLAIKAGLGSADQTRLATAISELTRNAIQYAGKGVCKMSIISDPNKSGVHVVVEDDGPGIVDMKKAMKDGFATGNGLGAGLPGTKRLVTFFNMKSQPGHTKITIELTRRKMI